MFPWTIICLRFKELSIRPKKKVFDWRNPTDPIYPADPTYLYQFFIFDFFFSSLSSLWRLFAPVDITIGAYSSIFNHFQTSNQKSVLKNKWLSSFKKSKKSDLPILKKIYVTPIKPNFF